MHGEANFTYDNFEEVYMTAVISCPYCQNNFKDGKELSEHKNIHQLCSLCYAIEQLLSTYKNMESLLYTDFSSILLATVDGAKINTNLRDIKKKGFFSPQLLRRSYGRNWFLLNWLGIGSFRYWWLYLFILSFFWIFRGIPFAGGYFTFLLYKRRVKKNLNNVSSTCHFYLHYEENQNNSYIIKKFLEQTLNKWQIEKKPDRYDKLRSVLEIAPAILGIPILASVNDKFIVPALCRNSDLYPFVVVLMFGLVSLLVYSIVLWILPNIRWYKRIIHIYNVRTKENRVYDLLIPLQRHIISLGFPKITGLLDEQRP